MTLHVGHVLEMLAGLEAGSVQTVVTSPPYYGLRAYGTDPQVWGGDPSCSHSLEETAPGKVLTGGTGTASAKQVSNAGSQYGNALGRHSPGERHRPGFRNGTSYTGDQNVPMATGATCTRCGAWRGELGSEGLADCLAWARGQEPCSVCFVCHLVTVFRAVRRVLHDTGTIWVNLGDSYSGSGKGPTGHNGIGDQGQRQGFVDQRSDVPGLGPKQLLMMPTRVALALQHDGWVLRSAITWAKKSPMPESVRDRPTNATEMVYLLAKNPSYFYDAEAVRQPLADKTLTHRGNGKAGGHPDHQDDSGMVASGNWGAWERPRVANEAGANLRNFWLLGPEPHRNAHFATFVSEIPKRAILSSTSARGQCPACGTPWRRDTVIDDPNGRLGKGYHDHTDDMLRGQRGVFPAEGAPSRRTVGWAPSCRCDTGDPVPQTVLDPFVGSGTTLAVARWHQRRAVGIELNPEYARLVTERLRQGVLL